MSSAKPLTSTRRAANYRSQTGRRSPTPGQRRRMIHKSRKRLGFIDYSWWITPEKSAFEREIRFRQRQILGGSLLDPKAHIMITGTGA